MNAYLRQLAFCCLYKQSILYRYKPYLNGCIQTFYIIHIKTIYICNYVMMSVVEGDTMASFSILHQGGGEGTTHFSGLLHFTLICTL